VGGSGALGFPPSSGRPSLPRKDGTGTAAESREEFEQVRAEHDRLVERFVRWGATDEEAVAARDFLGWLGVLRPSGPTARDLIEFLWEWVPRKVVGNEEAVDALRSGVARFLRFLEDEGLEVGSALRVADDRLTLRRRLRTFGPDRPEWWREVARALEATGMEPFPELPDGFTWGALQGPEECAAHRLLTERLTGPVLEGEIDPSRPGWRERSAALQMRWLDTPSPAFDGRPPRAVIAIEREENAPELERLMAALERSGGLPDGRLEEELHLFVAGAEDALEEVEPDRFPRVSLPSEDALVRAVEASMVLGRVRALLEVVGEGRPLTARNRLTLADARALAEAIGEPFAAFGIPGSPVRTSDDVPSVRLTFAWARAAGFLKVARGRVTPTRHGRRLGERPLDDWVRLFDAFVWKLRWPRRRHPGEWKAFWSEEVASLVPRYLEEVYLSAGPDGEPLLVVEVADWTWRALDELYDLSSLDPVRRERWAGMVEGDIRHGAFRPLIELGALEGVEEPEPFLPVSGEGDEEEARALRELRWPWAVRATPLGLWAIRRVIRHRWGFEPPLAGDVGRRAPSAEALLAAVTREGMGPGEVRAEAAAYREARGPAAAAELARAVARGGPMVLTALECLDALDPGEVEPHLRRAAEEAPSRAGALQCASWLATHGFEPPPVEFGVEEVAEATAWAVVAAARADGPEAMGELFPDRPEEEQVEVVEAMGRLRTPHAREALEAVARGHPLPGVRKAARRALHRLRTSGR
jgi:hypothetical protein